MRPHLIGKMALFIQPALRGAAASLLAYLIVLSANTPLAFADELPVRGVIEPVRQAVIATDLVAPVATISGREGDRFGQGDLLIAFDCSRFEASLVSALADLDARTITHASNETLLARNAIARHDVLLSGTEVTKADANAQQLQSRVDQCRIQAPFAGKISEILVHEFEFPAAGAPLMRIISDDDLEIRIIVPSDWLSWLSIGAEFRFTIDETSGSHDGKIIRVGASVDPVSQTVILFGAFDGRIENILSGMSGSAVFADTEVAADGK